MMEIGGQYIKEEYITGVSYKEVKEKIEKKHPNNEVVGLYGEEKSKRLYKREREIIEDGLRGYIIKSIPRHRNKMWVTDLGVVGYYLVNKKGEREKYTTRKPKYIRVGYKVVNVKEYYIAGWYKPY